MMCYYLNVQFQGQRVNIVLQYLWCDGGENSVIKYRSWETIPYIFLIYNFERSVIWTGTLFCVVNVFFVSNPTQFMEIRVKNNEANYLLVRQ